MAALSLGAGKLKDGQSRVIMTEKESNPTVLGQVLTGQSYSCVPYFTFIMLYMIMARYVHHSQAIYGLRNATGHSGLRDLTPACKALCT